MKKIEVNFLKIEKIFLDYLLNISKINLVPVRKENWLIYNDDKNEIVCIIDDSFPHSVDCKIDYSFYKKWYTLLSLDPKSYHNLLKSAFSKITGYTVTEIIPYNDIRIII